MSETPIPSNHITSGKIAVRAPSPLMTALDNRIKEHAAEIIERITKTLRQAAIDATNEAGISWYWEAALRASVSTTDSSPYRAKLEELLAEKLAEAAAARLLAEPAPAKRAKP
jgi:hypothetical protein